MATIIFLISLFFIGCILSVLYGPKGEKFFMCLLTLFGVTIVGFLATGLITAATAIWSPNVKHLTTTRSQIVSLNDGTGYEGQLHGSFFLGIGSVVGSGSTHLAYTWYERNHDGSLSGRQVLANGWNVVKIYETAKPGHGRVEKTAGYQRTETPSWLFPLELHEKDWFATLYKIYVPKGTVVHGYTLNGR